MRDGIPSRPLGKKRSEWRAGYDQGIRDIQRLEDRLGPKAARFVIGLRRVIGTGRRSDGVSRRTRLAVGLSVRLLPPGDRLRYREEFAAELAGLPRIDQAPYAIRLIARTWSLRRSLRGKSTASSASVLTLVVAGGGSIACQVVIGWPAALLGGFAILAVMWTVGSADRTSRLATLIRSVRGEPKSPQKK
jgi:hypothetical protein